jgi:hypothetical protein
MDTVAGTRRVRQSWRWLAKRQRRLHPTCTPARRDHESEANLGAVPGHRQVLVITKRNSSPSFAPLRCDNPGRKRP